MYMAHVQVAKPLDVKTKFMNVEVCLLLNITNILM